MNRWEEWQTGDALEPIRLGPVTRLDLIKYAGASGDFNPIHTIDEDARKAGLPGIIAHGMWTMGHLSRLFAPYLSHGFIRDYSVRFQDMVFLGDVIAMHAVVESRTDRCIVFGVKAVNQADRTVLKGRLTLELADGKQ